MDIVFNIVENIDPESVIILTISFAEKYNVSIGKDRNNITIYFYESDNSEVIEFHGSQLHGPKYKRVKKYIQDIVDNTPLHHITGFSSAENKKYLQNHFLISNNSMTDIVVNLSKNFY